ncbi:uncharacterized protein TM35_000061800 [Trypanosoma theileri]|uniref:C2 domain-containing protein n=1 Tax=Trypanosoma theileri TaxID=67003 RepID=A0A1X0P2Q7_9TRYP|nr:uncharacterized protein TM35_000061800 [Trypanosoma theileri]ORC91175.1 hypothetical protein TM35_000061800 [Trypanosoma theileri]
MSTDIPRNVSKEDETPTTSSRPHGASLSLTISGQQLSSGVSFVNQLSMLQPHVTEAPPSAMKKHPFSTRPHGNVRIAEVVKDKEEMKYQKMYMETPDDDFEPSDVLLQKVVEKHEKETAEPPFQNISKIERAAPPRWFRRFTDLRLLLNSTHKSSKRGCVPIHAAINQLTADVQASQSLERDVTEGKDGSFCQPSAMSIEKKEREQQTGTESNAIGSSSSSSSNIDGSGDNGTMTDMNTPQWLFIGTGKRMTHQLSESLSSKLNHLLEIMGDDTARKKLELLGVTDESGSSGVQRSLLPPLLLYLHRSIMKKTIISDLFASPINLHKERAQEICEGFRTQTPRIHLEYIVEEDVRPTFDSKELLPPHLNTIPMKEAMRISQRYHSFVIHIDYIRFRPIVPAMQQPKQQYHHHHHSRVTGMDATPPSFFGQSSSWGGINSGTFSLTVTHGGRDTNPLVSFTREEKLISTILDNYEPYRMIELNLLPQLKSRLFYKEQLDNLYQQPHPTEEQKHLITKLSRLYQLTCELEHFYLKSMISTWQQIVQMRGENMNEEFLPLNRSGARESEENDTNFCSSSLPLSKSDMEGLIGSRQSTAPAASRSFSLLTSGSELQSSSRKGFRMSLRHRTTGAGAGVTTHDKGNDLLEYDPVIEGLIGTSSDSLLDEQHNEEEQFEEGMNGSSSLPMKEVINKSQRFKVLVFARTNGVLPPQFVGSTTTRVLSTTKILFFNETFELNTMQEPQEILLHIVSVGNGSEDVVATVHILPSFTRAYLLLPLQPPISFTHRGHTYGKREGAELPGIISLSTTWTAIEGMTVEEIEDLFLRGDADPMDPQFTPLLKILKSHYMEVRGRRMTESVKTDVFSIQSASAVARVSERIEKEKIINDEGIYPSERQFESERLEILHRRWLCQIGRATPKDILETRLFSLPIPLEDAECHELQNEILYAATRGKHKVAHETGYDPLFPDAKGTNLTLTLSLSPLPQKRKLQLWQEWLRHLKIHRISTRKLEDHELLERYVILPKIRPFKFVPLKPESQLNPRREERPKTGEIDRGTLLSENDSRIVVHIMKAMALPKRSDETPLEPFVEVSFVYDTVHSRSEVGTSPSWFETLNIPFCPPDFDDDTLSLIEDDIVISVYDKVEIPMAPTAVATGTISHETHYRTERRLLGTLRVPFFSLYEAEQARMEGLYPLSTPRWLLGYYPDSVDISTRINPLHMEGSELHRSFPSIQLYIALWPPLRRDTSKELDTTTISRLVTQLNVSAQLQHLHSIALKWRRDALKRVRDLSSVNPIVEKREIEPFVFCTTGDLTFVCRYLLPGGGPPPLTVKTVEEAIRFISLLLFRIDTLTWGDKDVWSTNAELLRTREGDYEELSLLLAHFLRFLAPNEVTYIVTGRGTVHERVVMVLHSFNGELRLIDPRTGMVCPVHDPHIIFFRDVHMVVSHDQLWANIQLSGAPHRMDWNLNDHRFWLPCFDHEKKDIKACLPFIAALQRETLTFAMPDPEKEKDIEQQLRKAVRRALITWRNNRQPAFHHGLALVLQSLLKEAEDERSKYASVRQDAVTIRATEVLNEYFGHEVLLDLRRYRKREQGRETNPRDKIGDHVSLNGPMFRLMGSPVNAAYRPNDPGYQHILQQVFETSVHEVGTSAVSFAVGVYVKGYTSEVYSMWVFLVALYEVEVSPSI